MKQWAIGLLVLLAASAHAQDSAWRWYGAGGFSSGGDRITGGTITVTGTTRTIPFEIRPGTATPLRLGAEYRFTNQLALRASAGRAVSDPTGSNGSLTFTTTSGELLGLYRVAGGLRFGLGVRQSYADLKGTGISAGDWRFTATPGVVLEAQYLFSNNDGAFVSTGPEFGFALRLVSEKFQDPFDKTYSGDHFEVGMLINF